MSNHHTTKNFKNDELPHRSMERYVKKIATVFIVCFILIFPGCVKENTSPSPHHHTHVASHVSNRSTIENSTNNTYFFKNPTYGDLLNRSVPLKCIEINNEPNSSIIFVTDPNKKLIFFYRQMKTEQNKSTLIIHNIFDILHTTFYYNVSCKGAPHTCKWYGIADKDKFTSEIIGNFKCQRLTPKEVPSFDPQSVCSKNEAEEQVVYCECQRLWQNNQTAYNECIKKRQVFYPWIR